MFDLTSEVPVMLKRVVARHGATQAFLFGPSGQPFWAANTPVANGELPVLSAALDLLESLEAAHSRPFMAHDPAGRFIVAALDSQEEFFLVVISVDPDRHAAEARVAAMRRDLQPVIAPLRQARA